MRSLRDKLNAMASAKPEGKPDQPERPPLFCEERVVPWEELFGVERSSLREIRLCDPGNAWSEWSCDRLLFLDTETTGLSGGAGTLAFLVGAGWLQEDGMHVRQLLIRSYDQEREMLTALLPLAERTGILVTYNGKSFDVPLLNSRFVLNGIRYSFEGMPHLDLLHVARRIYRLRLKRCTLQRMEEMILDKRRDGDLPGSEAPERFFQYQRTGVFEPLSDVVQHNREDVVSLAQLTGHICGIFRMPDSLRYPEDQYSMARTLRRAGDVAGARSLFRCVGGKTVRRMAQRDLALLEKQTGRREEAAETWRTMIREGSCGIQPYVELAKYCEHELHAYGRAISYASDALNRALDEQALGHDRQAEIAGIRKRIERLRRREAAGGGEEETE